MKFDGIVGCNVAETGSDSTMLHAILHAAISMVGALCDLAFACNIVSCFSPLRLFHAFAGVRRGKASKE